MELAKYKACICEGAAETAIIDILLDYGLLIFSREEMIEEEVIRCREGKKFEEKYLRKGFMDKISVIRILDSRRENFKLSKAYTGKVDVINVITAPEIEMLIIFNENKYKEFKKTGKKPSSFCKEDLKMTEVKSYDFVKTYFSDPRILVTTIKKYHEIQRSLYARSIWIRSCNGKVTYYTRERSGVKEVKYDEGKNYEKRN